MSVKVNCCDGCNVDVNETSFGPECGSPEALESQRCAIRHMKNFAIFQTGLGTISLLSSIGALVTGFMVDQINYPIVDGLPLLTAILTLCSGYFASKVARCEPNKDVSSNTRCYVIAHYVFNVTNVSVSGTACTFAGWAISVCTSSKIEDASKCIPNHNLIFILNIINCVVFIIIALLCIAGLVYFCLYARVFGFKNQRDRVAQLEQTVATLQSQLHEPAPPPYSTYDNRNYQTMYKES